MANKAKATTVKPNRRETIEALRRQQRAQERRKTMLFVGVAVAVGLALIAAVAVPAYLESRNDPTKKALASFGVPAGQAGCDAPVTDTAVGAGDHVTEGTKVNYPSVPPSYGRHDGNFIVGPRPFYTSKDVPSVEKLVHSLEHGYTILWHDSTVTGNQLKTLQNIAAKARTEAATRGKFIVAPLDESRGNLPAGKHIALSHWGDAPGSGAQAFRQYCGQISGEVVEQFIKAHPYQNAPEPNAA